MTTIGTGTVTRVPYTVVSAIASRFTEVLTMPDVLPIVFVVDDDLSVRESLELLIKSAGWRPETFVSAQEFLSRPQSPVPCCLLAERTAMPIIFITGHGDVPMPVQAQVVTRGEHHEQYASQH